MVRGVSVDSESVKQAYDEVRADDNETVFALFTYEEDNSVIRYGTISVIHIFYAGFTNLFQKHVAFICYVILFKIFPCILLFCRTTVTGPDYSQVLEVLGAEDGAAMRAYAFVRLTVSLGLIIIIVYNNDSTTYYSSKYFIVIKCCSMLVLVI